MFALARAAGAAVLLLSAGCVTCGPGRGSCGSLDDTPAKRRIEAALPEACARAVTSPAGQPSVQGLDRSGSAGSTTDARHSEQRFRYTFRMVASADHWHQEPDRSWPLPPGEYPRVARAVYDEVLKAAAGDGAFDVRGECDGSTFVVRYRAVGPQGQPISGTVSGRVGPEDPHRHEPPLKEPYYTQIAVDVCEDAERAK